MLRTDQSVTQSQIYYFVHLLALCPSRVTLRPELLGNRIRPTLLSRINVHDRPSGISLRCPTLGIWPSLLLQFLAACAVIRLKAAGGENNLSFSLGHKSREDRAPPPKCGFVRSHRSKSGYWANPDSENHLFQPNFRIPFKMRICAFTLVLPNRTFGFYRNFGSV